MARRGGGREEVREYEERAYFESDGPAPARARPAPVRARDLLEVDVNTTRRERSRDRQPEFMRQERVEDQPLVLRKREVETFERPIQRRREPSIERERVRTRFVERERERTPSPVERERVRTRVVERTRDRSPSPVQVERVRSRVVERESEREIEPERYRTRIVETERERDRSYSPPGERIRTRVVERDRERSREREPSLERTRTTTRIVERERERERSPSPIRERERIRTRVVERERERSLSSESSVSLPREPPIIRAPPIHQEIVTHHRHIDHGYDYQPAPTPPPPMRTRAKETRETDIDIYNGKGETEIDIHTSTKRSGREGPRERESRPTREFYDDDVLIERDRERLQVRESHTNRRRSRSARRDVIGSYEAEEDYYARKTEERAYMGEAYNGATRDWAIVDVPPGTERVKMDGIGGASQEITWQRYNGVRRSKFVPERDSLAVYDRQREYEREEVTDRRIALPPKNKYGDMWTEITKDLVVKEAIEEIGYDYEETEYFYYVFQFLKYEDIQELVFLSEDIRKARQSRIREIAIERERLKKREVVEIERRREIEPAYDEERIIERDIFYEAPPPRRRGHKESITIRDTRDVREYR